VNVFFYSVDLAVEYWMSGGKPLSRP
jgi:hypothetical protein